MRLDLYISDLKWITRSQSQELIKKECIIIDWKTIKKNAFNVDWEEVFIIKDLPAKNFHALATKMPLDIVYEDEKILVLNKDKWKQVHPWDENDMTWTLLSWLRYYFSPNDTIAKNDNELLIDHIWFIHRLDKDTSWTLLISKNKESLTFYQTQFANREVEKIYLTLVYWKIEKPWKIDSPIWRSKVDRKKMAISEDWKNAITLFNPINFFPDLNVTLLKVQILTGRTHQIRVHLSSIWFPVLWDSVYWNNWINKDYEKKFWITSQVLHSYRISLKWQSWEQLTFLSSPKDDFDKFWIDEEIIDWLL